MSVEEQEEGPEPGLLACDALAFCCGDSTPEAVRVLGGKLCFDLWSPGPVALSLW